MVDPRTRNPRVAFVNFLLPKRKAASLGRRSIQFRLHFGYSFESMLVGAIATPRPGLEPGTCGLTVLPSVGKSFLIRLLQHTPSFKSSYEQPKSSCKVLNEVT